MSTWSIIDTRNHVASCFGESQLERVSPSLDAMAQRQLYARYHFQEVRRLLASFQSLYLADTPLMIVTHGQDEKAQDAFQALMLETGAHALASVLSIHAIADVTSFAVYQALGFGLRPGALRNRDISASKIQSELRRMPGHEAIADILNALLSDSSFKHVSALANHSKHQGLIKPMLSEDWTGEREQRHELGFAAFEHEGNSFPKRELTSLLEPAYILASRTVVDVDNQMNAILERKSRSSSLTWRP